MPPSRPFVNAVESLFLMDRCQSPSAKQALVNEVGCLDGFEKTATTNPPIEDPSRALSRAWLNLLECRLKKKIADSVFSWLRNNNPKNPVSID
jgi:hypothetical protein